MAKTTTKTTAVKKAAPKTLTNKAVKSPVKVARQPKALPKQAVKPYREERQKTVKKAPVLNEYDMPLTSREMVMVGLAVLVPLALAFTAGALIF